MLTLSALTCARAERNLFVPIDLELQAGECVELLGPNGVGKSTLLRTLIGMHGEYSGHFEITEFLYQGHRLGLDELMNPCENLAWFDAMAGAAHSTGEYMAALERVGLGEYAFQACGKLSQGQQRRVAIARWLLSKKSLWLLDEPFTALDKSGLALLNGVLAEHCASGGAVLCATHIELTVARRRSLQLSMASS